MAGYTRRYLLFHKQTLRLGINLRSGYLRHWSAYCGYHLCLRDFTDRIFVSRRFASTYGFS
jgi:hypothetical protein